MVPRKGYHEKQKCDMKYLVDQSQFIQQKLGKEPKGRRASNNTHIHTNWIAEISIGLDKTLIFATVYTNQEIHRFRGKIQSQLSLTPETSAKQDTRCE